MGRREDRGHACQEYARQGYARVCVNIGEADSMAIWQRLSLFSAGLLTALLGALGAVGSALAAQPEDWAIGFQPAVSPTMVEITRFNDLLFIIIVLIVIFVMVLLGYCMWRFSEKRNPTPSKTTHNFVIEVIWTVVPALILVALAFPSMALLYYADRTPGSGNDHQGHRPAVGTGPMSILITATSPSMPPWSRKRT